MSSVAHAILDVLMWGILATLSMTSIMYASQNFGWSRLNIHFLLGTLFTDDRNSANVLGFLLYMAGGPLIAFFYFILFDLIGGASWWMGALVGFVHGALLLTALLPLIAYVHPRIASEYDGPDQIKRLEPPGFLALHYGRRTPITTLAAHIAYGVILGIGFSL